MARYFYTTAIDSENYNFDLYYGTSTYSHEAKDYFDLVTLEKTFKGFEYDEYYYYSCDHSTVETLSLFIWVKILRFTAPEFDEPSKTVSYYESKDKAEKGIRTTSKIGKYIRKVAPYFNDKQVESLVNCILEANKAGNYTHHTTDTPEGFEEVYTKRPESGRNLGNYKCINASCMRDKFGRQKHPCSVYGSGDFVIHYLLNEHGRIAARAIVCKVDNVFGPIYASSKFAGKFLEQILTKEDYTDCDDAHHAWEGAKLLKVECEDGWLAPYIDVCSSVTEHDDFFEITYDNRDHSISNTGGYVRGNCKCAKCGDRVSYYDVLHHEGDEYCNGCLTRCDHTHEYTTEECVAVYYGRGAYHHYNYCMDAAQEHAVYDEAEGKWFTKEYAEQRKNQPTWITKKTGPIVEGDIVRIIANGNSSRNHVGDIGVVTQPYFPDNDGFEVIIPGRELQNSNGCYTRLRDMIHYEFAIGDKVKRKLAGDVVTIISDKDFDNEYLVRKENDSVLYAGEDDLEPILTDVTE